MRNHKKRVAFLFSFFILTVVLATFCISYFVKKEQNSNIQDPLIDSSQYKSGNIETVKRTLYKNGQPAEILEEKSIRNPDGSLETVVTSNNKKLSHHIYTKDFILGLSSDILNLQQIKSLSKQSINFLTTGENIIKYISSSPNLLKTSTTLNGKKATVYLIGSNKISSFVFIKTAFAQTDNKRLIKVFVDESTGVLKRVEQISEDGSLPQEVIEYSEGPTLSSYQSPNPPTVAVIDQIPPEVQPEDIVNKLPQLSLENQLKLIEERLRKEFESQGNQLLETPQEIPVLASMKEIAEETKEVRAVSIQSPVIPAEAIHLYPLSTIPTSSGYNSPIILLSSTVFNQQARFDQMLKEEGGFDNEQFTKNNIKARIDGIELDIEGISLIPELNKGLKNSPWTISLMLPKGLTPGYHTVEVFMVDSWYLAPNLLVTLPRPDEKVLELELFTNPPPILTKLPENGRYKVILRGKNFIKPFTVALDDTILDDKNVEVNGTEELILIVPESISPPSNGPAYSVTITKDGQKAFRPSFLILGGPQLPFP